jgi:hypothetical protein
MGSLDVTMAADEVCSAAISALRKWMFRVTELAILEELGAVAFSAGRGF